MKEEVNLRIEYDLLLNKKHVNFIIIEIIMSLFFMYIFFIWLSYDKF